jgi:hypothetical protein
MRILDIRWRKRRKAGEDCIMGSFTKYYQGDQDRKGEMGGEYSKHWSGEQCVQNFGRKI